MRVIIKKQAEYAKKLEKLSEKIKVNSTMAGSQAGKTVKSEKKEWTLDNVKKTVSDDNNLGFALI